MLYSTMTILSNDLCRHVNGSNSSMFTYCDEIPYHEFINILSMQQNVTNGNLYKLRSTENIIIYNKL